MSQQQQQQQQHEKHKRSVEVARGLLLEWRGKLGQALGEEGDVVRRLLEQGLKDTEALVDKVQQACEMREQVDGLPEGVVKAHMGKALAQLESELGLTSAPTPAASTNASAFASAPAPTAAAMDTSSSSASSSNPPTALGEQSATAAMLAGRVARAGGVQVKGFKDALALAVHAILLEEGFACYAEEEQRGEGPTGFAAPIRAVPPTKLVPPRWNADPANVCLTYRHDKLKGRDLKLKVMWMEERALLELQDRGASLTLTLHGPDYVRDLETGGGASEDPLAHLRNLDGLRTRLREGLLQPLLPQVEESKEEQGAAAASLGGAGRGAAPMAPGRSPFQGEPPFAIPVPSPLGPMAPPDYGYGPGRRGGLVPDFGGDLEPGGGWGGPGGGNLMGPNHPAFTGEGRGGGFGPGPGMGMPAPRFDPYGPVIPPVRGGPPARGPVDPNDPRGRGRAFREPDPDHLPPPGPPGNMYF